MKKMTFLMSMIGAFALMAQQPDSPSVKGVFIVDDTSKLQNANMAQVSGVQFDGIEDKELEKKLIPLVSSLSLNENGAQELSDTVTAHYLDADGFKVRVSIPEQTMDEGVIQLVVAKEEFNSKESSREEGLKGADSVASNDLVNHQTTGQEVAWIDPYQNLNASISPIAPQNVKDVENVVADKKAWKISSGVDNTGTDPIGPLRIFAKLNVDDFIFSGHTLELQATTADHYNELQTYSAKYKAALPWKNFLVLNGSYTETAPLRAAFPQKHRQTYKATGHYEIPQTFEKGSLVDEITYDIGYDFKGTNTNILFENDAPPVEKKLTYISQFVGGVKTKVARAGSKVNASLDLIGSPARMLSNQSDADFDNLRNGATPIYLYSKASFGVDQKLPKSWNLSFLGKGQFSASNLIPSEQFALGGMKTIRGYAEKAVVGDNAIYGNIEVKTPNLSLSQFFVPRFKDSLHLVGFVDAGYAWYREAVPNKPLSQSLIGIGSGLRYAVSSYVKTRLDVGFPLITVQNSAPKAHLHFNAAVSF